MAVEYLASEGVVLYPKNFTFYDWLFDQYYWDSLITIPANTNPSYRPGQETFRDPTGREWILVRNNYSKPLNLPKPHYNSVLIMISDDARFGEMDAVLRPSFSSVGLPALGVYNAGVGFSKQPNMRKFFEDGLLRLVGFCPSLSFTNVGSVTIDWRYMLTDRPSTPDNKLGHCNYAGPTYSSSKSTSPLFNQFGSGGLPIWGQVKNSQCQNPWNYSYDSYNKVFGYESPTYITEVLCLKTGMAPIERNQVDTMPYAPLYYYPNVEYKLSSFLLDKTDKSFDARFWVYQAYNTIFCLYAMGYKFFICESDLLFEQLVMLGEITGTDGFFCSLPFPTDRKSMFQQPCEIIAYAGNRGNLTAKGATHATLTELTQGNGYITSYLNTFNCNGVCMNGFEHLNRCFGFSMKLPPYLDFQKFECGGESHENGYFVIGGVGINMAFDLEGISTGEKAIGYNSQKEITKIATQGSETTAKVGSIIY